MEDGDSKANRTNKDVETIRKSIVSITKDHKKAEKSRDTQMAGIIAKEIVKL